MIGFRSIRSRFDGRFNGYYRGGIVLRLRSCRGELFSRCTVLKGCDISGIVATESGASAQYSEQNNNSG